MGDPLNIGIVHGSHRYPEKKDNKCHQGSTSLVEIPDNCMIICHAYLSHYGARSIFKTYKFIENLRAFAYMVPEGHKFPPKEYTHQIERGWCELDCDNCVNVRLSLVDHRCDHDMVWKHNKEVDMMLPSEYVMGDLNTLGWAIVKGFEYEGDKLVSFSKDVMEQISPRNKHPFDGWNGIQTSIVNKMQFGHFIATTPHEELFEKPQGKRMIKVSR